MFTSDGLALGDALNRETVAAEIEAALVGSVGLVLSVPLTTLVATVLALRLPAETLPAGDICTLTEREQRLCAEQGERDRDGRGKRAKREEERVTSSRIEPKALGSRPSRSLATNERGLGTHIVMRRGRYVPCSCRLDARVAVADPRCPLWTMCERNADLAHSDSAVTAAVVLCYPAISGAAASANGLPSESRHTAHRSPGWMTEPPSSRTRSIVVGRSATLKYGREAVSPGPDPRSWTPRRRLSVSACHPDPAAAGRGERATPRTPCQNRRARSGSSAGNSMSGAGIDASMAGVSCSLLLCARFAQVTAAWCRTRAVRPQP